MTVCVCVCVCVCVDITCLCVYLCNIVNINNFINWQCGLQHLPASWSVCTSRSWLLMGTRQFQDTTRRHPCYQLEAGLYQGVSANPKCVELGWRCIPLAVESYGAWEPEALRAFSQVDRWLATRLAIRGNTPKSKVVAELYGRNSWLLVRANARSILV